MPAAAVKVVHLHAARQRKLPEDGETESASRSSEVELPESPDITEIVSEREPAAPPQAPRPPAKAWRWVRSPSPAAVIARALDPRPAARPLDPVRVLARHAVRQPPATRTDESGADAVAAAAEARGVAAESGASYKARPGDTAAAFWNIWLAHRDYLRQHSLRLSGGNVADAEDALSEAMIKAAQAFPKTEIRNERAWLLRLVHNACMDGHRSHHRYQRIARDITDEGAEAMPAVAVRGTRTPEDLLLAIEKISDLQRALSALPRMLSEPLLLYLNDLSDGEIAGNLRVTKEVVRKRRQIARAWLRRETSG